MQIHEKFIVLQLIAYRNT